MSCGTHVNRRSGGHADVDAHQLKSAEQASMWAQEGAEIFDHRELATMGIHELLRPAWMVSCPAVMPWFAQVAAISFAARAADSRAATIQPTAMPPSCRARGAFRHQLPGWPSRPGGAGSKASAQELMQ
jgi:hypothetical protein